MFTPLSAEMEDITRQVLDASSVVHAELGPGLLQSVYETCLAHELRKRRIRVDSRVPFPVVYRGARLDAGLQINLLVDRRIIIELESVETLRPAHDTRLLTYLRLTKLHLGFLINFNVPKIRDGIRRHTL